MQLNHRCVFTVIVSLNLPRLAVPQESATDVACFKRSRGLFSQPWSIIQGWQLYVLLKLYTWQRCKLPKNMSPRRPLKTARYRQNRQNLFTSCKLPCEVATCAASQCCDGRPRERSRSSNIQPQSRHVLAHVTPTVALRCEKIKSLYIILIITLKINASIK